MTNEELIKKVQELAKELGKTPTIKDFELSGRALYLFGGWNNFLKQAKLEPNRIVTDSSYLTKDEVLQIVSKEIKKIGSIKYTDYEKNKSLNAPSHHFIKKITGYRVWSEVLKAVGIDTPYKNMGQKESITKNVKFLIVTK